MALYEYQCDQCRSEFELLVRGGDTPACPQCHSDKLSKQFSVPAAHSNGSRELPIAGPCGRPQCATRCMNEG